MARAVGSAWSLDRSRVWVRRGGGVGRVGEVVDWGREGARHIIFSRQTTAAANEHRSA